MTPEGSQDDHELEPIEQEPKNKNERADKSAPHGPKKSRSTADDVPIPDALDAPAFREQWNAFLAHRRELRKPLTPTAAAKQLAKLAEWEARIEASGYSSKSHAMGQLGIPKSTYYDYRKLRKKPSKESGK